MQQPYTNTKPHAVHIGGKRIEPGETRLVDMAATSGKAAEIADPAEADDPLAYVRDLADDNVSAIKNAVPHLSDEELVELQRLEAERDKPRVSVSELITAEQLKRAADDQAKKTDTE